MSSEYGTKGAALKMGIFYAGRFDLYKKGDMEIPIDEILKNSEVKIIEGAVIGQLGYQHEDVTVIEFPNKYGKPIRIGTSKFRDGFDCWLIDPVTGMAVRT